MEFELICILITKTSSKLIRQHKYNQYSDEDLIAQFKLKQNNGVIGELYNRYGHLVFGVCLKILKTQQDSEDTTMQIFQHLGEKIAKHQITYLKSWLYQVARNECFMVLRKTGKNKEVEFNENHNDAFDDDANTKEQNDCFESNLAQAMNMLKTEHKMAIELFYDQEKSYVQISEEMRWELKKVKSYIQNAKRNLKLFLQNMCNEK